MMAARCYTRYSSYVDCTYGNNTGRLPYFGDVMLKADGTFQYRPNIAGNSERITFTFIRTDY